MSKSSKRNQKPKKPGTKTQGKPTQVKQQDPNWFALKLQEDLQAPNKGRFTRVASIIGFWAGFVLSTFGLFVAISTKPPTNLIPFIPYPTEQFAVMVALVSALFATYKLYLDEASKTILQDAQATAEAGQVAARRDVYDQWVGIAQLEDNAILSLYRLERNVNGVTRDEIALNLLIAIREVFEKAYKDAEVMSVNIAVPDHMETPKELKILKRWPEHSGATLGRVIPLNNTDGWGCTASFHERKVRYLPDTKNTSAHSALYNSVLSVPILDSTEENVLAIVNIDSKKVKAFGDSADHLEERVDQALQLATPTFRLLSLLLSDNQTFSHYRKR